MHTRNKTFLQCTLYGKHLDRRRQNKCSLFHPLWTAASLLEDISHPNHGVCDPVPVCLPTHKVWTFHRALVAQRNCRIHDSYVGPALTERLTLSIRSLAPAGNPTSKRSRSMQTRRQVPEKHREQQKPISNPTFNKFLYIRQAPGRCFTHGFYNHIIPSRRGCARFQSLEQSTKERKHLK